MNKFFKLEENGTTIKTEILAGITTFLSMSYILVVNPSILSDTGMNIDALFTATALSAIIGCLIMGIYANFPVAQAPGMGANAFFTYTVVLTMGYSWQQALFAIFLSGLIFLSISVSGIREKIINMIPTSLKFAVSSGIGFFIAFIGMQNAGIIVNNDATLVGLGDFTDPVVFLALFGTILTFILIARNIGGAIFIGMFSTGILGVVIQLMGTDLGIIFPTAIVSAPPSLEPLFGQAFVGTNIGSLITDVSFWTVVFSFLFIDFFDTSGTLIAVGTRAGFINEKGELKNSKKALLSDATATTIGSVLGTSSVTTYVESLAGVNVGGRTGLTTITVAICFILALFFSPVLGLVTSAVTAPALIVVGALMAGNMTKINGDDFACTASSFITILMMVVTYSIAEGIAAGFITFTVCKLAQCEREEIHPIMYGLCVLFILHYLI